MSEDRTPRAMSAREKVTREVYAPPSVLPEPEHDPVYAYRWVATHVLGQLDPTNAGKRFREGWEPVDAKDHPELMVPGNAKGHVEVGGLLLCRMLRSRAKARDEYYNGQAEAQMQSVDNNFMKESDPRMPLFRERKSDVTRGGFGNGTK